jgi:hypothetical protein
MRGRRSIWRLATRPLPARLMRSRPGRRDMVAVFKAPTQFNRVSTPVGDYGMTTAVASRVGPNRKGAK